MLFLGFGQHFLGNGCHGDKNTVHFEKFLYTFSSWKCTIYKYMLYGHYMSHIICLIYFVIILDVDKAPTNAVGLHYHGNHYLKHFIKFHISAITLERNIVQSQMTPTFRGTLIRPVQLQCWFYDLGTIPLVTVTMEMKNRKFGKKLVYASLSLQRYYTCTCRAQSNYRHAYSMVIFVVARTRNNSIWLLPWKPIFTCIEISLNCNYSLTKHRSETSYPNFLWSFDTTNPLTVFFLLLKKHFIRNRLSWTCK